MYGKKSKLSGLVATIGAVALMASMTAPAFASTGTWYTTLSPFRMNTYNIAAGRISASSAGSYSIWLNSIDPGNRAYMWATDPSNGQIGYQTLLPKNNGGTSTTLSYFSKQNQGNPVRLAGRTEKISRTGVATEFTVNFG